MFFAYLLQTHAARVTIICCCCCASISCWNLSDSVTAITSVCTMSITVIIVVAIVIIFAGIAVSTIAFPGWRML